MRNGYHSLHSHAHIQIFVRLLQVIFYLKHGRKVTVSIWEQEYSFVVGCPNQHPQNKGICMKGMLNTA